MNTNVKIFGYSVLFLLMLATTIWASLQQNLFTEFNWNGSEVWFKATLVDFYINQIILWFWVVHLEKHNGLRAFWLVIFICFGSMGTTAYIIQRLIRKQSLFQRSTL